MEATYQTQCQLDRAPSKVKNRSRAGSLIRPTPGSTRMSGCQKSRLINLLASGPSPRSTMHSGMTSPGGHLRAFAIRPRSLSLHSVRSSVARLAKGRTEQTTCEKDTGPGCCSASCNILVRPVMNLLELMMWTQCFSWLWNNFGTNFIEGVEMQAPYWIALWKTFTCTWSCCRGDASEIEKAAMGGFRVQCEMLSRRHSVRDEFSDISW